MPAVSSHRPIWPRVTRPFPVLFTVSLSLYDLQHIPPPSFTLHSHQPAALRLHHPRHARRRLPHGFRPRVACPALHHRYVPHIRRQRPVQPQQPGRLHSRGGQFIWPVDLRHQHARLRQRYFEDYIGTRGAIQLHRHAQTDGVRPRLWWAGCKRPPTHCQLQLFGRSGSLAPAITLPLRQPVFRRRLTVLLQLPVNPQHISTSACIVQLHVLHHRRHSRPGQKRQQHVDPGHQPGCSQRASIVPVVQVQAAVQQRPLPRGP
jgi:hypothetical protein